MPRIEPIRISRILVNEQTLRYEPEDDSIIELANDIAAHGLLQPVGVAVVEDGGFQLLWGGRRLAAHRRLGLRTILAHVYDRGEAPIKAVALVENLQRVQLSLAEECEGVRYLHYDEQKSPDQISALLSKSRSWVMRRLALPNLPVELRGAVFDGRLTIGSAEEISKVEDPGARSYLASQAIQCGWGFSEVQTGVRTYLATPSIESAIEAGQKVAAEQSAPVDTRKVCSACGQVAELSELVSVWIHSGGCDAKREDVLSNIENTQKGDDSCP